jgi:hypothetical protein
MPEEERCSIPLPGEEEEAFRSDISLKEYLKKERNGAVNRLRALYGNAGIIDVTKKDLKDAEGRAGRHGTGSCPKNCEGRRICLRSSLSKISWRG